MFALGMSVKQATDIVDHINSTLTYSQHESLARDVLLSNKSVGNLVRSVGVYQVADTLEIGRAHV